MKMNKTLEEYEDSNGWSSELFADKATKLFKELKSRGVKITVGRSVIYVGEKEK